ncbi:hypothetical protein CAAN1_03S06326 [[Candida] anglica]|uniref:Cyclin-like domain-containing protein n=1 Tax=[Candida] anglica TaxID=148631 RepID=A0ABP0EK32_9ASCO
MLGPPSRLRPKPYPLVLEHLESRANKRLTNEYRADNIRALASLESCQDINPAMIDLQPEIQWFMRPFLLDFIVELHSSFKLQPQTLFRCFNIVDRYCAKRIVFKRHYQLVGCTALWIAAKYEDKKSRVPTLKELALMCRNAYDEEMFVQMERHILSTLEWSLGRPTLEDCLQLSVEYCNELNENTTPFRYNRNHMVDTPNTNSTATNMSSGSSTTSAITAIGRFLCELSLYSRPFLEFETSQIAIAANLLACSMLQIPTASRAFHDIARKASSSSVSVSVATTAHENLENLEPEVLGTFLNGFDETTPYKIRKIGLLFMQALNNITDVLSNKYKPLGVLAVVQNYIAKNMNFLETLHSMSNEVLEFSVCEMTNTTLTCIADSFLSLNLVERPQHPQQDIFPVTPPSTSQSVFSDRNSSSSSLITPTTNVCKGNPFYTFSPAECAPVVEASPYYQKQYQGQ